MSAQILSSTEANLPEWFDPFPEPRTLPNGWDLDSIVPRLKPEADDREDTAAASPCS